MAVDRRPAPVVTIVDPVHPGPVREVAVPAGPQRSRLRTCERWLLGGLVVLLAVGGVTADALRAAQHRRARLAALHLVAVPAAGGPVLGENAQLTLMLRLDGDGDLALPLRRFAAEGGWRALGVAPRAFAVGQEVGLRHELSCDRPVAPPAAVRLWVVLDGAEHALRVPVAEDEAGRLLDLSAVCGDLPATEAVVLSSSSITARGAHSEVLLRLVNTGVDDVSVRGVGFPGFAFRPGTPLPVLLAGRAPGLLSFADLVEHPLPLDARVAACGPARAALDAARQSGTPDLLELRASGRGGDGSLAVDVQGLEAFLEQAWVLTCTGP